MIRRSLFLLFAVLLAAPLTAATIPWTTAGTTAIIDETSVPLYAMNPPYISFNGSGVGLITAYFNVTDTSATSFPGWNTLQISYFDNAAPSQVTAKLFQVDKCDGTQIQLCFVAGFDSATNTCNSCSFTQFIDFNRYEYYVLVTLYRATTALDPKLFAVRIF
jgi:hypothetical protein